MGTRNRSPRASAAPPRWYRGADVPLRVIRRFARQVAERFQPQKIILFGSHAYGTPHADSDVDILVVMPARNELGQAMRIRLSVDYEFPLDLLVRTPRNLAWRLAEGDWFLREIMAKGKILYEKGAGRWLVVAKGLQSQPPETASNCSCCRMRSDSPNSRWASGSNVIRSFHPSRRRQSDGEIYGGA